MQFSGFAMSSDSMMGVPFVHLGLKGSRRGGFARADGFFSFAVNEGDTILFTSIGYDTSQYIVPKNVEDSKLSVIQLMTRGAYRFKDVDIYYWGSRDKFRQAFLDAHPNKDLQDRALENTDRQLLAALGQALPIDGGEAAQRYMQARAAQAYYYNQQAPQNIFNPLAWAEFIQALKRGDFKKKADPPLPSHDY